MTFAIGPNGCVMDYVECEINFSRQKRTMNECVIDYVQCEMNFFTIKIWMQEYSEIKMSTNKLIYKTLSWNNISIKIIT